MAGIIKPKAAPGLEFRTDLEIPTPGPHEVLIKVKKSSICGTDVHILNWDQWSQETIKEHMLPLTIGHEFVGEIMEFGPGAGQPSAPQTNGNGNGKKPPVKVMTTNLETLKIGSRVTAEGHVICGKCRACLSGKQHLCKETIGIGIHKNGGFAEYVVVPERNVYGIPQGISDDIAAFMDPIGNAVHSCLSFDLVGEDVLITGAGPIGVISAAICKQVGARTVVVTDMNDYRLSLAKKCGADITVNVGNPNTNAIDLLRKTMSDAGMTEGFDVGLEMSGNQHAYNAMLNTMRNTGKIALLGIPSSNISVDMNKIIFKGLTVKGVYGREMFETWYKMKTLLVSGLQEKIAPVLTHHYNAKDFMKGMEAMKSAKAGKVVLDWAAL